MSIVVVEDHEPLRDETVFLLKHAGYSVEGLASAKELYRHLECQPYPEIVILDLGLPDQDGLSVARKLRAQSELGIIMLTARGELEDRVKGLEFGADAYLVKPVAIEELKAVIDSVSRRIKIDKSTDSTCSFRLDSSGRALVDHLGNRLKLTATEGVLMAVLSDSAPLPVSRKQLSEALGAGDYLQYDERRLEAAISRLRKKLKQFLPEKDVIKAARGRGYQLVVEVKVD